MRGVTTEALTARWRSLIDALALDFFYVGPEDDETVCGCVERIFAHRLDQTAKKRKPIPTTKIRSVDRVRRAEDALPVTQGQLVMGIRTGTDVTDSDYYACAVANEMLGVSPVSKLFVNVREKHGLCYHCSSHYNMYKGVILITCGLISENRALAEREIMAQLDALRNGDFEDDELLAAKKSLENAYRQLEDNPTALESYYLGRALYDTNTSLAECRDGFARVTREDILRVCAKMTTDTVYFLNGTAAAEGEEAEDAAD